MARHPVGCYTSQSRARTQMSRSPNLVLADTFGEKPRLFISPVAPHARIKGHAPVTFRLAGQPSPHETGADARAETANSTAFDLVGYHMQAAIEDLSTGDHEENLVSHHGE